jgi:L-ribulose-5-phosphate 4-epimerase
MDFMDLRESVYATTMRLAEAGLIRLSAGNISAQDAQGNIAITPAGMSYSSMRPSDITIIDFDGQVLDGRLKPSSETPMHAAIYRNVPNVGAVVHTHSVHALGFAASGAEIPVVSLEVLLIGGPVPVAPYACPGTAEAGRIASEVFASRPALRALLLRNHGALAIGADLEHAFQAAVNCETGAQICLAARQTGREPRSLSEDQIAEIFRVYRIG